MRLVTHSPAGLAEPSVTIFSVWVELALALPPLPFFPFSYHYCVVTIITAIDHFRHLTEISYLISSDSYTAIETFHYATSFVISSYSPDTLACGHLCKDPLEQLHGNGVFFVMQLRKFSDFT